MSSQGRCVLGIPGASLADGGDWAKTDLAGQQMAAKREEMTAAVIDTHARVGAATVLHDLTVPSKRMTSNIDHIVVCGDDVWLLDTKNWAPGFYWTMRGTSRRGFKKTPHIDKQTLVTNANQVAGMLRNHGCAPRSVRTMVVVWPSQRASATRTWALDIPGAGTIPASALDRWARATMDRSKPANPQIVELLVPLLSRKPRPTGFIAAGVPS